MGRSVAILRRQLDDEARLAGCPGLDYGNCRPCFQESKSFRFFAGQMSNNFYE